MAPPTNGVGTSGQVYAKKVELNHKLIPYTKIN